MRRYRVSVHSTKVQTLLECYLVSAAAFQHHIQKSWQAKSSLQVFAASMQNIQKALRPKLYKTREEV
jgi:hypothetical protein